MRIFQRRAILFIIVSLFLLWCSVHTHVDAAKPEIVLQHGPSAGVLAIAFSPDGKTLASSGADGTIRLWSVRSREIVATLSAHQGNVQALAFSRDGANLASGSDDKTIKLWNIKSATLRRSLNGHQEAVRSVTFAPNGKTLVSGSHDATAKLWDTRSGELLQTFSDPKQRATWVNSVAFSPDGKRLAVCAAAYQWGLTLVWDITTRQLKYELSSYKTKPRTIEELENNCVAFAPNGKLLATVTRGGVVKMWNAQTGKLRYAFTDVNQGPAQGTRFLQLAFSPDSRTFAGTSVERTIKLWDAGTGKLVRRLNGLESNEEINAVAFSPDGTTLAATHANNIRLTAVKPNY